jgi:hypothetical protein
MLSPGMLFPGMLFPAAPRPAGDRPGSAGAAGGPAFAAGVKDGEAGAAGVPGVAGENRGILAAAVAWEAAEGPGAVAVGADSDAAGP